MKLVTYRMEGQMWSQVGALVGERIVPAAHLLSVLGRDPTAGYSMVAFIQLDPALRKEMAQAALREATSAAALPSSGVRLLAPVPRPSKVIGLGYNYRALCLHEGVSVEREPELFAKMPTSVTGPYDPIVVPRSVDKIDFEAELGVIMGRLCKNATADTALSFVAGYTVINDVTAKIIPRPPESGSVVLALKGADTFAPCGPCMVTADEAPDPQNLQLLCRVNGEERQNFSTSDMIHPVARLIEYISERITLEPGDLISTGTSLGIGIIQKPPVFLTHGDVVECELCGYGFTRNVVTMLAHTG
jgi:2-keto-4-pentenoate hydratase/2-oxohepta-3-ene-1,7-dioic acid hydratase in catechol pathway